MSCRRHRVAAAGVAIAADELLPNGWFSSERHLEPRRVDLDSNLGPADYYLELPNGRWLSTPSDRGRNVLVQAEEVLRIELGLQRRQACVVWAVGIAHGFCVLVVAEHIHVDGSA